jgi:diadenosine tetraphosphate (Ap4A) HIT family hydrolase
MGKREPGDIISESKEFVVFRTIKPYTEHHLLVVPRVHVCSVDTMKGEEDAAMIERMALEGKNTLNKIESGLGESAQFSFHIPPLNSIDHLHLHAIGRPETLSMIGGIKYWTGAPYCWDVSKAAENTRSKI